ncbi:hypothetical protein HMPREF1624_05747 [Sporothrix schenckii ATCC 58251]|uniref:Uncharacterized protein n=1 Tax=Sporothrix schenckii (strain ATCC 58251 / de Perez 2211183) TaxID=1391915 RepID=U7PRL7_SPOS1|nr:hypothetical protein HMPREF1624_05747 [Sporothrix schenckii ATCC 58251]
MATESNGQRPPHQLQQPTVAQAIDIIATTITTRDNAHNNDDDAAQGDSENHCHITGKISEIDTTTTRTTTTTTTTTSAATTPAHVLPVDDLSASPLSRLASPSDSDFSFSQPSAGFQSLLGAATSNPLTPLSSLDGGESWCRPSLPSLGSCAVAEDDAVCIDDDSGSQQDSMLSFGDMPNSAGDENTTIATSSGSTSTSTADVLYGIGNTDSASGTPSTAPYQAQHAHLRGETPTLALNSAAQPAAQPAPQLAPQPASSQQHSGPATQCATPHARAKGEENATQKTYSNILNSVSAAKPLAGALATTSSTAKFFQPEAVKPKKSSPPPPPLPQQPAIVRTTSSHGNLPLRQPVPDPNGGSTSIVSNIAQLEETAEQLSSTGSIETAIREAHQELKRSDSRRSSILAASIRQASSRGSSVADPTEAPPRRRQFSRQSSIIELNSAARAGALSPYDYIMSPSSSVAGGTRQRSNSKASSIGSPHGSLMANILGISDQSITGGDDIFPFLSRHGTGKSSIHSTRSGKLSMPEIAELEPPSTLTQDALDEADRLMAAGEDPEDDDTIRASAHQHIDVEPHGEVDDGAATGDPELTPNQDSWVQLAALGSSVGTDSSLLSSRSPPPIARPSVTDFAGYASPPQYVPNPAAFRDYTSPGHTDVQFPRDGAPKQEHNSEADVDQNAAAGRDLIPEERPDADHQNELERPASAASGGTFDQAQLAFDDFDGVHCDPESASLRRSISGAPSILERPPSEEPARETPPVNFKHRLPMPPRPTSYLDPQTGQQMLFYPARVPAMLQLPQKLSRNPKAADRNARRSQVMSMMMTPGHSPELREPKQERASRVWLPDPMDGDAGSHFMSGSDSLSPNLTSDSISPNPLSPALSGDPTDQTRSPTRQSLLGVDPTGTTDAEVSPATGTPSEVESGDMNHLRRPSRLMDADKRKSRLSTMTKLPAQLRASAFFDHPSTTANIEVKNGSAMDTLDSILDAAAAAPVGAFTDHQFAGHLGKEVYGTEKRRPKKKAGAAGAAGANAASAASAAAKRPEISPIQQKDLPTSKSRSSFMSIMGHIRKVSEPVGDGRSEFEVPRVRKRLSKNFDGAMRSLGLSEGTAAVLAPDDDERVSDDEEYDREHDGDEREEDDEDDEDDEEDEDDDEDEDELVGAAYQGAPTTLLAELQLRKQQQKLRTRPINQAFPNGMHSTLLELDAVAEIERRARKGKKVNLAWEDPSMLPIDKESDDEDVPLGMLFAAKAAGHSDISAVVAEMNRPLGLMEKKELEDNEPLSRRRDRLQGRDTAVSMYLGPNFGSNAVKRQSMLNLTPTLAALNQNAAAQPDSQGSDGDKNGSDDGVEEVEDEPLAARLQRIKAKEESELPRARPVSMAFSEELLNQFVDPEEEAKERERLEKEEQAKSQQPAAEEEETLGQRRRRLQAEKEAQEQGMVGGSGGGSGGLAVNGQALHALTGSDRLSRRISMANVLSAHPADTAQGAYHPREAERIRREQEAARAAFEKDQKMAAMRAQMPRNISNTSLGGGVTKSGGFLGGRLNDGAGGNGGMLNRTTMRQHHDGPGVGHWANPGTMGGPMGNASALNLTSLATTGNMGMANASYGSGLNTMGMSGMGGMGGMGMNNRNMSFGGYGGMPQQGMMANSGMAYGGVYSAVQPAYNPYGAMQVPMQMQMPTMGMPMGMPMQMPMQSPPQVDRVERWRQGVLP